MSWLDEAWHWLHLCFNWVERMLWGGVRAAQAQDIESRVEALKPKAPRLHLVVDNSEITESSVSEWNDVVVARCFR